jgi:hypothetical protein
LEGTLRGHIGLIEEALDRLEGTATEADRGKKMYRFLQDYISQILFADYLQERILWEKTKG